MKKIIIFTQAIFLSPYCFSAVNTAYQITDEKYYKEYYQHQTSLMSAVEKAYALQYWQTLGIAIMVFIMVAAGLYLSYVQLKKEDKEGEKSSFYMKLGAGSFELNSSIIGLIILAMSFLFFKLYIDNVYEIKVVNTNVAENAENKNGPIKSEDQKADVTEK